MSELVDDGYLSEQDGLFAARRISRDNAMELWNLMG